MIISEKDILMESDEVATLESADFFIFKKWENGHF
jgi:hypothetical protein